MANEWKSKISAIFAEQGDTVDIPVETQADNQVSFATGYTKNYNKDAKDDLGNPLVKFGIERTKFNYLFKIITSAIKELQETLPVYTTDTDEQKVDVGAIVENTVAFNALTNLLCIDDTGKASKITKEELIAQLNPNIDLSNSNISVTAIADTALNNFLAIDGTTVKKANKLLQEVIQEIDLSADNVKVTKETTYTNDHKILVVNSAGATHKVDKLLQSAIDEINLSADNINVKHINTGTTTLKPLMVDENGKITSEDSISSDLVKGDMLAKGFKTIVMTKEQYPNGIDDLTETGLYSLASMDEYKDIVNDSLPSERKEYIKMVLGQILTLLNYSDEQTANLDITKFSDLIYCPIHQIQVVGVSQGETDNTTIQQTFILFGIMLGTRIGTMTLNNVEFNNFVKMNGLSYVPIDVKAANNLNIQLIDHTSPITSFDEITENGYYQINKNLANKPDFNEGVYLLVMDLFYGTILIKTQILFKNLFYNPHFMYRMYVDNSWSEWDVNKIDQTDINDIDLSADNIKVSKTITQMAVNTLLATDTAGKTFKIDKAEIINGIVEDVNAGIDLANYYNKTESDDRYFNKDTDVLSIKSGGTGNDYGKSQYISNVDIYKLFGLKAGQSYTTQQLVDIIANNYNKYTGLMATSYIWTSGSRGAHITDLPYNPSNLLIKTIDTNGIILRAFPAYDSYDFSIGVVKGGKFRGWKKLRNADGSIPAELISPTVLKYENSDGTWTETKLTTGEIMVFGGKQEGIIINSSGEKIINLPKGFKKLVSISAIIKSTGVQTASTNIKFNILNESQIKFKAEANTVFMYSIAYIY